MWGTFAQLDETTKDFLAKKEPCRWPEVFRGRDSRLHGTLGLGFNFRHWSLDAAADLADTNSEFLISLLYRR